MIKGVGERFDCRMISIGTPNQGYDKAIILLLRIGTPNNQKIGKINTTPEDISTLTNNAVVHDNAKNANKLVTMMDIFRLIHSVIL